MGRLTWVLLWAVPLAIGIAILIHFQVTPEGERGISIPPSPLEKRIEGPTPIFPTPIVECNQVTQKCRVIGWER